MLRLVLIYGVALAALAFLLEWLDYKHAVRAWTTEFYIACLAIIFVALGIWVGNRLTQGRRHVVARNGLMIEHLGISPREYQVLEMLAAGHANKVIARRLSISPNTVKTHVAKVFEKLEVASRTQAIHKARELNIIP
ncbi:MAG TPA: response regulator transcription factor [Sphingorhabdus sp.]|jgi:DNA-binding CsgD family transcriptional regulator|nr:response regulator transcription factor [Sphingorhabdus sp.]